jgi:hypothetical protein
MEVNWPDLGEGFCGTIMAEPLILEYTKFGPLIEKKGNEHYFYDWWKK